MNDFRQAHGPEHDARVGELAEELRLLAEVLLERVEPMLRRAAADGGAEWAGCSWCPLCAAAALARGEHHDVVASLAAHGTAIVTVLREALAGVPVEPVLPTDEPEDSPADRASADEASKDAAPQDDPSDDAADPFGPRAAAPDARSFSAAVHDAGTPSGAQESEVRASSTPAGDGRPRYISIPVQIKV
ncbi:hypothetical protein [Nocardia macrotermitis]|uniref:Uncharacterized protein n=1 Tax=Nocardia macrotermitis TaxID=2585198 RepID=A0A7K0D6F5_9NOCA|nr:hypothetical protein [Nocardia macrotermitis]MQY21320.1 hypothetical protein [Nocardia macrotermitis]